MRLGNYHYLIILSLVKFLYIHFQNFGIMQIFEIALKLREIVLFYKRPGFSKITRNDYQIEVCP